MTARTAEHLPFLATTPARTQDWRLGLGLVGVSGAVFLALLPLSRTPLTPIPGFIGVYQSALVVIELLTAVLLMAKFAVLKTRALLFLACAFLFSALMASVHALTFPGLFRPTGLLAATPQTTAWLYMFWHSGFPLLVIAYARTRRLDLAPDEQPVARQLRLGVAAVVAAVAALALLASLGSDLLPPIMNGNTQNFPVIKPIVSAVCLLSAVAAWVLWRHPPHSVLDVWLMVECVNWVFEVALSAVFNAARFDLGFYAGRLYGLLAALFILAVLLYESTRFYARLVKVHRLDAERNIELQRLYAKARELDLLKTRFFANMSHEIRTPMNAIIGITYLLKRDEPRLDQVERLDKIGLASSHLLSIINDILDYSKIESGALTLEAVPFPLSAVMDHTRSLIEDAAQAKGLRVLVDYGNCPPWLVGDPVRLRQALLNYASNAVKFTERGHINLRCTVDAREGEQLTLRFEVGDTGIGIPPEAQPELFKAFKQVDVSTTRKYGGTGLGLAITQRLAQLMGGTVGMDSEVGEGSRFWFTARLHEGSPGLAPPRRGQAEEALRMAHSGRRILVAEDDPINQEIARQLLRRAGLEADLASDGQQALAQVMAGERTYDLVLMDIQMPVMDGIEAARRLRALPLGRDLPIIALSANAHDEDRKRCMEAGMNDFVGKPVDPPELYVTLLRWLPPPTRLSPSLTSVAAAERAGAASAVAERAEQAAGPPVTGHGIVTPAEARQLQAVLANLMQALRAGDFHAVRVLRGHQDLLRAELGAADFGPLEAAVEGFDFEAAARQVEALLLAQAQETGADQLASPSSG